MKYENLKVDAGHGFKKSIFNYLEKHPEISNKMFNCLKENQEFKIKVTREKAKELTNIQIMHQLKEALQIAVRLEMTVLFEYLFACFSVINASDEVRSDPKSKEDENPYYSELRREYKNQLMIICIQEMYHMRMACDMLVSIGGIPNLNQATFPSEFGSANIPARLIRLNLLSLCLFAINEEPEESNQVPTSTNPNDEFVYLGISQLYSSIKEGFKTIHAQIGQSMFTPQKGVTCMGKQFYTDIDCVLHAIDVIMYEGEGGKGGILILNLIKQFIKWLISLNILAGRNYDQAKVVQEELIKLSDDILNKLTDSLEVVQDFEQIIYLYDQLIEYGVDSLPITSPNFILATMYGPSHWERFIMMLINYSTLMYTNWGNIDLGNDDFSQFFSRPSHPSPIEGQIYKTATQKIVDIANQSFQLLLAILQAGFIEIPGELNEQYQIKDRYDSIKFYPIMTILIYPIGELLSYFQLSDGDTTKTAGFPFIPSDSLTIAEPLNKFNDIIGCVHALNNATNALFDGSFMDQLDSSVGTWLPDGDNKQAVVNRVKKLLNDVKKAVNVIFSGFTNGIPTRAAIIQPSLLCNTSEISFANYKPVVYEDKYYMNIEFSGYSLFLLASDPDPTFDPRGFSGNMFMYEYTGDPDFTTYFYTENKNIYPDDPTKRFTRPYVPPINYDGVKITDVSLVIPSYKDRKEIQEGTNFLQIEACLKSDLCSRPFNFMELQNGGNTYYPTIPMFNYALSRTYGIDPVNIDILSKNFHMRRANFFTNPITKKIDPSITYVEALLKYSDSFGPYPIIANDRFPQSGGYLSWMNPKKGGVGGVSKTNAINAKSGTGQTKWDFYTLVQKRNAILKSEIDKILQSCQSDPLASLINQLLEFYNSKLIVLALMIDIPNPTRNNLSYLCSRYLQMKKILQGLKLKGYYHEDSSQFYYNVPLNANDETYFITQNNGADPLLKCIDFIRDENWYLDFGFGGMDYDALSFFMTGNMMIPVNVKLVPNV